MLVNKRKAPYKITDACIMWYVARLGCPAIEKQDGKVVINDVFVMDAAYVQSILE